MIENLIRWNGNESTDLLTILAFRVLILEFGFFLTNHKYSTVCLEIITFPTHSKCNIDRRNEREVTARL